MLKDIEIKYLKQCVAHFAYILRKTYAINMQQKEGNN